jgi:glycosyltransferase involved in cell wall biosynthesis
VLGLVTYASGLVRFSTPISTSNRPETLERCLDSVLSQTYEQFEVLVLDNSPHINTCERLDGPLSDDRVKCTHVDESYGVAGSRNWLMREANGDVYVIIDDDAYFETDHALTNVVEGFDGVVGIQAFKIIDHPDETTERILAPVSQSKIDEVDLDDSFRSSYYVGGGHAIKREVIETCGYYFDDLIYGAEELDLSYRALDAGFSIEYNPNVVVQHHPEPPIVDTDTVGRSELYYSLRNKVYLAYRYLPRRYVPSYLLAWVGYYASVAIRSGQYREYMHALRDSIHLCRQTERSPISRSTEQYLKRNHGRLWY